MNEMQWKAQGACVEVVGEFQLRAERYTSQTDTVGWSVRISDTNKLIGDFFLFGKDLYKVYYKGTGEDGTEQIALSDNPINVDHSIYEVIMEATARWQKNGCASNA